MSSRKPKAPSGSPWVPVGATATSVKSSWSAGEDKKNAPGSKVKALGLSGSPSGPDW